MPAGAAAPRRILVRLPNWVGDVVMATPALRALRAAHPGAHIVVEGPAPVEALLRGLPAVDEFLPDPGRRGSVSVRARTLRAGAFDWAVLLPDSARAALAPFLARIPRRAGYARDPLRRALLTDALPPPRRAGRRVAIPMVERYLRIARALGCEGDGERLDLALDPAAVSRTEAEAEARGLAGRRFAVVTPGASFGASKLWPPESFAAAADGLAERHGLAIVLAPAPAEVPIARRIASAMRTPAVVLDDPPTRLAELAAWISRSALLLSNDTGPRHMAVALGRPVVVVMGPTDPRHTAANLERQRVMREDVGCSPCHRKSCPTDHRCMTRLAPARVLAAAGELLA